MKHDTYLGIKLELPSIYGNQRLEKTFDIRSHLIDGHVDISIEGNTVRLDREAFSQMMKVCIEIEKRIDDTKMENLL